MVSDIAVEPASALVVAALLLTIACEAPSTASEVIEEDEEAIDHVRRPAAHPMHSAQAFPPF